MFLIVYNIGTWKSNLLGKSKKEDTTMTEEIKAALETLFNTILEFVKKILKVELPEIDIDAIIG